jgi:DNA topoisomerase-1
VDYQFTSKLEDKLDEISNGERDWIPVMEEFWGGFSQQVEEKKALKRSEVTHEALDEACPKCGKGLTIRLGKRGRFVGCTGYPECDYTRDMNETAESAEQKAEEAVQVVEGRTCPNDGGQLVVKAGRYGKFIGCANYPKCKHIEPLEKPKDTGVTCPQCNAGMLIERKSRYGKLFYSCNTYPKCTYATWNPPVAEACPKCKWPVLTLKTTKRRGLEKVCPQKECGYSEVVKTPEQLAAEATD